VANRTYRRANCGFAMVYEAVGKAGGGAVDPGRGRPAVPQGASRYTLQSVASALDVIALLGEAPAGLGVTDIARRLGAGKAATFRVVRTLWEKGFVEQVPGSSRYRLSLYFVHLASRLLDGLDLRRLARPHLESLTAATGEVTHLAVRSGRHALFVDKVETEQPMRMGSYVGWLAPLHCTALGKCLLAFSPPGFRRDFLRSAQLRPYTPRTITDARALHRELARVRQRGLSVDDEETVEGLCCFAVPVRGPAGRVVASMSVSGPKSRMRAAEHRIADLLQEAGARVSGQVSALWNVSLNGAGRR
jgi:IclR family KDG regulon transcriptional repressor